MKLKLTMLCMLLFAFSIINAQQHKLRKALMEENSISFIEESNTITYAIADIQKMTYEGNTLFVYLKDNTVYSADVASLSISNNGDKTTEIEIVNSINSLNLSVYPNPVIDHLQVRYILPSDDNIQIIVYNLSGQVELVLYSGSQAVGENVNSLNVSMLPSGNHLLQVKGNNFSITKILIKQ